MHKRSWIVIALVAIIVVAGASVGIARAQSGPALTDTTPAQLIADVFEHLDEATSISGDVTWTNDLLGLSMFSLAGKGPGDLTALLSGGTGRVWVQDGRARLEIQGGMGDTQAIADGEGIWVYSSSENRATRYTLPADAAAFMGPSSDQRQKAADGQEAVVDPVAAIQKHIEAMAPHAAVTLEEPVKVAGRDCYLLVMTPTADNTVFGSARIAIDAETFVPLRLEVFAKGTTEPVLAGGFTSVSYRDVADSVFEFTPPPGATVEQKELGLPDMGLMGRSDAASGKTRPSHDPLTLTEAAAEAGFTPFAADPDDPVLPFGGAWVMPAEEIDLADLMGRLGEGSMLPGGRTPGGDEAQGFPSILTLPTGPMTVGPTVVQRYGEGFGTVVLVQSKVPAELSSQLERILAFFPLVAKTAVDGRTVYQMTTALGSTAVWIEDGSLILTGGSVSQTDLKEFITGVR